MTDGSPVAPARKSFRSAIQGEDLIRSIDVDPATGRVLVGTFGYGRNLFCFSRDGRLLWKRFLPGHHVYYARWYDRSKDAAGPGPARRVVAATARGYFVYLLDGETGKVRKKFSSTEWPNYHAGSQEFREGARSTRIPVRLNPVLRQILVRGKTQLLAVNYDGELMWKRDRADAVTAYASVAEQAGAASFSHSIVLGGLAVSPDGSRLIHSEYLITGSTAQGEKIHNTWGHRPMILDARTGEVLARNASNLGESTKPGAWNIRWPQNSDLPLVEREGLAAPLRPDGSLGEFRESHPIQLDDEGYLEAAYDSLARCDAGDRLLWRRRDDRKWVANLDRLGPQKRRFYRCGPNGLIRCIDLKKGSTAWERKMSYSALLRPVGSSLVVGAEDGTVAWLDENGEVRWETVLWKLHEKPDDYPAYLESARQRDEDSTEEFYPVNRDRPGEYSGALRRGLEQLVQGGFEGIGRWISTAGKVRIDAPARSGKGAVMITDGERISQRLGKKVIPSATYLLEFFYHVEPSAGTRRPDLIAGALLEGDESQEPGLTVSCFTPKGPLTGRWRFGRLGVKTMGDTTSVTIGLEASGGKVRVDDVSFQPIRFPSANLLANSELHAIEPTYVEDIRVQYDRIPGSLRNRLMHENHVAAFPQAVPNTAIIWTQEQAFLHNGRLDDVGQMWRYQPDNMGFSVVLKKASYISHLVLYLNNAMPENVYQTISILANDMEEKMPRKVALMRGNHKRFVVVHFAEPVYTDNLKVLPGPHRAHRECITEIEAYGPLGGPEMVEDGRRCPETAPKGRPMFMGHPSHVTEKLPDDLVGDYIQIGALRASPPTYHVSGTASEGLYTYGDANGHIRSAKIPGQIPDERRRRRGERGPTWSLDTVTPTTTPARYAGRLLVGSADHKMHAIGDNGMRLWAHKTGGRVYSAPVPDGNEVYFGSDDASLYKVDIDSGMLIWQFETGGRIRSAPALVDGRLYFASWDGHLYAVDAASGGELWKSELARYTSASPAVWRGRIYIGDERGSMLCFRAEDGALLWEEELDGLISDCPVVTPEGALFTSEGGRLAFLAHDGTMAWQRTLDARLTGQPFATRSQLVLPTGAGIRVLRRADGRADERFSPPNAGGRIIDVTHYGDRICVFRGGASVDYIGRQSFTEYHGRVEIWAPKPPEESAAAK
jgi:hypothetical protein